MKKYINYSLLMNKETGKNGRVVDLDEVGVYEESLEEEIVDSFRPIKYYINLLREAGGDPEILYILDALTEHQEYRLLYLLEGVTNCIGPIALNLAMYVNSEDIKGGTVLGVDLDGICNEA